MSDQPSVESAASTSALSGQECPSCGNGVVANVSEWIGRRIMAIERES